MEAGKRSPEKVVTPAKMQGLSVSLVDPRMLAQSAPSCLRRHSTLCGSWDPFHMLSVDPLKELRLGSHGQGSFWMFNNSDAKHKKDDKAQPCMLSCLQNDNT